MSNKNISLSSKWVDYYGTGPVGNQYEDGAVGIELELESTSTSVIDHAINFGGDSEFWTYHGEDSLRDGFELVLRKPLLPGSFAYIKAMSQLEDFLSDYKEKLLVTYRTSLHVHVNIRNYTWKQIYNVVLNTFLYENILSYNSSSNRKGNLFCVRGCDAEAGLFLLAEYINRGDIAFSNVTPGSFKYGALNMAAIPGRGSVEFRFMDASIDIKYIEKYSTYLSTFVKNAADIDIYENILKIKSDVFDLKSECKKILGNGGFNFFCSEIDFGSFSSSLMIQDNILGIINVLEKFSSNKNKYRKFSYLTDEGSTVHPQNSLSILDNNLTANEYIELDYEDEDGYEDSNFN